MAPRRVAKKGFLTDYSVEDTYLLKPDRASGRAGILRARDRQSRDVLVKYWPRVKGIDNTDLEEVWRSEIRRLQRLAAVPRADDLFVQMLSSGQDDEGFCLVLDPGQGSPLEPFLRNFWSRSGNRARGGCSGLTREDSLKRLNSCTRRRDPPQS
jgi:hypothetical protein